MTNPWLVKANPEGKEWPFPSKRVAAAFAAQRVQDHPAEEVIVISRRGQQVRLRFRLEDDVVQTERCRGPKRRPARREAEPQNAAAIDEAIRALGYTGEEAKTIREVMVGAWTAALARGESVETPLGVISVTAAPQVRPRYDPLQRRRTGERKLQKVFQKHRKRIRFKPRKDVFPNPKSVPLPPPPIRRLPAIAINPFWPPRNPYRRY